MSSPSMMITDVDPDAKLDPLIGCQAAIAFGHATLHVHCAAHPITGRLAQDRFCRKANFVNVRFFQADRPQRVQGVWQRLAAFRFW